MKDFILLIPHYNNPEGLIRSIKSIEYPKDKFEVLVIDDGSEKAISKEDLNNILPGAQIKIITLPENKGIVEALNTGLKKLSKRTDYKYIARLDCGDICHVDRFTEQVRFLDSNIDVYLLGSWCKFTDSVSGKSYTYKTKTEHADIIKEMHLKCSFIHPTVMFRREVIDSIGYYPNNYPYAEDYAYFWKILKQYSGYILNICLVTVVVSPKAISYFNRKQQYTTRKYIINEYGTNKLQKLLAMSYMNLLLIVPIKLIDWFKYLIK